MDRNEIIENYLELCRKAHEIEYYWESGIATDSELHDANDAALHYYSEHGITRQEITDHHDSKRNVVKVDNVDDAFAAMQNFFS